MDSLEITGRYLSFLYPISFFQPVIFLLDVNCCIMME